MNKVVIVVFILMCHVTAFANGTLTDKFKNWVNQQKAEINQQLEQAFYKKAKLQQSVVGMEEELELLNSSNSAIELKMPYIEKINEYKKALIALDSEIDTQKQQLEDINLSEFSESNDFKYWVQDMNGLTTADQLAIKNEIAKVGQLQENIRQLTQVLLANDLTWNDLMSANTWDDVWLSEDDLVNVQQSIAQITALNNEVDNFDLSTLLNTKDIQKLTTISNHDLNLPLPSINTLGNQINLSNTIAKIENDKSNLLDEVSNKYKAKQVVGENYTEVIIKDKPSLKDMLFLETDLSLLRANQALVNASSLLGMQFSTKWAVGLGTSYQNINGLNSNLTGLWSGRLMTRMNVWRDILAVQVEGISTLPGLSKGLRGGNSWRFAPLVGTRLNMPSEGKLPLSMTLLRNFNPKMTDAMQVTPWQMKLGILF